MACRLVRSTTHHEDFTAPIGETVTIAIKGTDGTGAEILHPNIAAIYGLEKSPAPAVAAARRRSHLRARASAAEGVSHQGSLHIRQAYWSLTNS